MALRRASSCGADGTGAFFFLPPTLPAAAASMLPAPPLSLRAKSPPPPEEEEEAEIEVAARDRGAVLVLLLSVRERRSTDWLSEPARVVGDAEEAAAPAGEEGWAAPCV